MRLSKYRSVTRKLQAAYRALEEVSESAEYFALEQLVTAQSALRGVPDQLRIQVCKKCNKHGHYSKPGDPYTAWTCQHPDVPTYDIRTDEI